MTEDLLSTLDTVDRLAAALGLRRHQLCLKVGDLSTAAALADDWAAGRLSTEEARDRVEGGEAAGTPADPLDGSFRETFETGNSIPVNSPGRRFRNRLSP